MADYYGTDTVVSELREDGLLIIRINRPDMANALNGATSKAMENIMNNAGNRSGCSCNHRYRHWQGILCWRGSLRALRRRRMPDCNRAWLWRSYCSHLLQARYCSLQRLRSWCGMEIALSCDMVVASERAKFGCTEVGLGIIASTGGIVRLARDINRKDCMELLLTGKKIKADEAQKLGLINYVVPAEEVMDKAIELAEQCLKNAPLALKWTKYLVHASDQMCEEDAMRYCDAAYRFLEKTEDGIEGPAAFVEKREPKWVGR